MILNILVLDDNLDAARYELEKALGFYLGVEAAINVPDFFIEPAPVLPLVVPAIGGNPGVIIYFRANKRRDNIGRIIGDQIRKGDYDSIQWDAVIIDNNWAGNESENSGTSIILPALIERDAFRSSNPEYLILTWHFNDPAYHRKVLEELYSFRQHVNVKPIAKGNETELSEWFGEMLRARVKHKFDVKLATPNSANGQKMNAEPVTKCPIELLTVMLGSDGNISFTYGKVEAIVTPFNGTGKGIPEIFVATLILIRLGIKCNAPREVSVLLDYVCDRNISFDKGELGHKSGSRRIADLRLLDAADAETNSARICIRELLSGRPNVSENPNTVSASCSEVKRYMESNHRMIWPTQGGKREKFLIWVFREAMRLGQLKLDILE